MFPSSGTLRARTLRRSRMRLLMAKMEPIHLVAKKCARTGQHCAAKPLLVVDGLQHP